MRSRCRVGRLKLARLHVEILRQPSQRRPSRLHGTVVAVCGTAMTCGRSSRGSEVRLQAPKNRTEPSPSAVTLFQNLPTCLQSAPLSSAPTVAICWTQETVRRMQSSSVTSAVPAAKVRLPSYKLFNPVITRVRMKAPNPLSRHFQPLTSHLSH